MDDQTNHMEDKTRDVEHGEEEQPEINSEQQPTRVSGNDETVETEGEQPFHDITVPRPDKSSENIPEVQILNSPEIEDISATYKLPFRHNRGKPPNRYSPDHEMSKSKYPIANQISTNNFSEPHKAFVHKLSVDHIPKTVGEAMKDPKWKEAIEEEMKALQKNDTWALEPLPKGKKIVGCKWVFSIKYKADGSIEDIKQDSLLRDILKNMG